MKFLLLTVALFFSTACTAQEQPVAPGVIPVTTVTAETPNTGLLYRCSYKYDSKYDIEFVESKRVEFHPPTLPELLVYRIIDTRGQRWAINEYDWQNYNCTTTTIPQG
jgi:hypothetical protein